MKFICLYTLCHYQQNFDEQPPDKWYMQRYAIRGEYRHKCPKCGSAMAPEVLLQNSKGGLSIGGDVVKCFSDCVNAGFCFGHDQYAPDCEIQGIKQKCLHAIFQKLEILHSRLDDAEKRFHRPDKEKPLKKVKMVPNK